MKRVGWLIVVLATMGACSQGETYPQEFKSSFISECLRTSGGEAAYCQCALDHLEANVPYEDAQSGQGMLDAIQACS